MSCRVNDGLGLLVQPVSSDRPRMIAGWRVQARQQRNARHGSCSAVSVLQ